jgi:hypothetical protein
MGLRGPKPGSPQRGGRKKTGGRSAGKPNKISHDVRLAYLENTDEARKVILEIMRNAEDTKARLEAAKEINNRGLGKSVATTQLAAFDGGSLGKDFLQNMAAEDLDAFIVLLAAKAGVNPDGTSRE